MLLYISTKYYLNKRCKKKFIIFYVTLCSTVINNISVLFFVNNSYFRRNITISLVTSDYSVWLNRKFNRIIDILLDSERSEECIDFTMIITSRNNAPISNFGGGFRSKSEYPWCIIKVKSKHFPTVFKKIEKNKKK
ncbi:Uncharacterized protein FWK35_00019555 [Aphis craccivora]|uniref:Uncharacterized protein n=1 Tax=Aphis craccivora TaxID=307492 RepID=A0A6G0Y934_APHCR|nr:Uncharacterized protein FWK35_00019555 [Aphis craccivora]